MRKMTRTVGGMGTYAVYNSYMKEGDHMGATRWLAKMQHSEKMTEAIDCIIKIHKIGMAGSPHLAKFYRELERATWAAAKAKMPKEKFKKLMRKK